MQRRNWMFAGAVFAGMGAAALTGAAQDRSDPRYSPQGQPWRGERGPDRWLDELRNAPDPSSTVEAYSRARERLTHDAAAEHAYMHRMIDFGLPELAERQAANVAQRRPRDGTAHAVLAYMHARRGNDPQAFAEIVVADRLQHDEPFIERTAGQLVAWLDTRAVKNRIPRQTLADVERMRDRLEHHPVFRDAYNRARREYEDRRNDRRFGARHAESGQLAIIPRGSWSELSSDPYACVGPGCEPWRPAAFYTTSLAVSEPRHFDYTQRPWWERFRDGLSD